MFFTLRQAEYNSLLLDRGKRAADKASAAWRVEAKHDLSKFSLEAFAREKYIALLLTNG